MSEYRYNQPAQPGEGPAGLPTPSLPDSSPAQPGEGPAGLPTPSLPNNSPAQPGEGPAGLPTPSLPSRPTPGTVVIGCPAGYHRGVVQYNQSYADLLIENNVSYDAMRSANPTLSPTNPLPGTIYCAPPAGSRRLCPIGSRSYVMNQGETLASVASRFGVTVDRLLRANSSLAPLDFQAGRVICIP